MRTSGPRRQTSWGAGTGGTTIGSLSATGKAVVGAGLALAVEDHATLVRTRGHLALQLAAATAAGDGFIGAFGVGIVTDEAFAAGIAAIPGPLTAPDWEGWFVHQLFALRSINIMAASNNAIQDASSILHYEIDSKAMRKFSQGQTMVAVVDVVELGTAAMEVTWDSRALFKLS